MAAVDIFWKEAINQIKNDYINQGNQDDYDYWISVINFYQSEGKKITVSVPSLFFRDELVRRNHVKNIVNKLKEISGQDFIITFIINSEQKRTNIEQNEQVSSINMSNNAEIPLENANSIVETQNQNVQVSSINNVNNSFNQNTDTRPQSNVKPHTQLRQDYTFDNFVLGDNNAFAYNAALAVAKNPGHAYNPLLIYGGVGLGKTHLMQAIGNACWNQNQNKVIFTSAEDFMNEFINSIGEKKTNQFKNKYRTADVLLIDDIHFLNDTNKNATQEELFYVFNALYDSFKQIVFTCDRPVSELKYFTERLRSRVGRGLNVDLQIPDYETRHAIIEKKLQNMNKVINPQVIDLIAKNVVSNVRDLESSLTTIIGYTELIGKEITLEIAEKQLRNTINTPKQDNISIDTIVKVVANHYGISNYDLKGKKRTKNFMLPRQVSMYIIRELTEYSTNEIGAEFDKDHSTVMHSIEKIEKSMLTDSGLQSTVQLLIREVKEYKK